MSGQTLETFRGALKINYHPKSKKTARQRAIEEAKKRLNKGG